MACLVVVVLLVRLLLTAGCTLGRDCSNRHCELPFESDRPLRSCDKAANKQISFRIGL